MNSKRNYLTSITVGTTSGAEADAHEAETAIPAAASVIAITFTIFILVCLVCCWFSQ